MTIGIGVATFNRPEFAEKSLKSILRHCSDLVAHTIVYNDGSSQKHTGAYKRAFKNLPADAVINAPENHGVAFAKNRLIERLFDLGCDWLIIAEDDIRPLAPEAVTEYVRICESNDIAHMAFAHHGAANADGPVEVDGDVSYYEHSIGAWNIYSREALETVGLFDENFHQAWEHVELTLRLAARGFTSGAYRYADATDSAKWLQELPHSIEKSSIRPRSDWHSNIREGLLYWASAKPETYSELFGPGKPLEGYAQSITGA